MTLELSTQTDLRNSEIQVALPRQGAEYDIYGVFSFVFLIMRFEAFHLEKGRQENGAVLRNVTKSHTAPAAAVRRKSPIKV